MTDVYWGTATVGAAGAWYGVAGPVDGAYAYGDWYDPADAYDPATNSGGITADPNGNDGSGWDQPEDGSQADPNADPGADNGGDTSGGDTSGGDPSGESVTRLHLYSAAPSSSSSPSPPSPSPARSVDAAGCFTCTMGCRTDAMSPRSGRQAVGVSDASIDDACGSAVRTLAQWSHDTRREKIVTCQRIATP